MFQRFKKKDAEAIYAFCDGQMISLDNVKDQTFSQRMMGDGCAIIPENNEITAPFDGEVVMLFPTKHAIGLRRHDGLEILIHIGMDTVNENGKGFTAYVERGDRIRCGDPLLKFDKLVLSEKGYDLTIPCIITNLESYNMQILSDYGQVTHTESILIKAGKI